MTAETDAEFVERIGNTPLKEIGVRDGARLFALARRGAAVQWRPIETVTMPVDDYKRLLQAAEADDTIVRCETCNAWLAIEEPACASVDDYTGCWKMAAGQEMTPDNCKSYRALARKGVGMKLNIDPEKFLAAVDREGDREVGVGYAAATPQEANYAVTSGAYCEFDIPKPTPPGGNVVPFNGITTLDIDADVVLRSPIGTLDTAVVAGIDKDGNEYFASSYGSTAETLFLLERFKKMLLERHDDK